MFSKILLSFILVFSLSSCSIKKILFSDTNHYGSPEHYDYEYSLHTFNSYDSTALKGMYLKTDRKSKGLIVLANAIHLNMSSRFSAWLWLIDEGYDLFTFDYRGYGDSKAEPNLFGFRDDVNSAIEYAHNLDPAQEIIIIGQSMGGSFVIDALAQKEYPYVRLAVIDSTFTGFASSASAMMMRTIILFPFSWLPYLLTPTGLDSIDNVAKVNTPLLYVTGDNDPTISYENSQELYAKSYSEKGIWIVNGAGHVKSFDNSDVQRSFIHLLKSRDYKRTLYSKEFIIESK